jgi:hypothetical protein
VPHIEQAISSQQQRAPICEGVTVGVIMGDRSG